MGGGPGSTFGVGWPVITDVFFDEDLDESWGEGRDVFDFKVLWLNCVCMRGCRGVDDMKDWHWCFLKIFLILSTPEWWLMNYLKPIIILITRSIAATSSLALWYPPSPIPNGGKQKRVISYELILSWLYKPASWRVGPYGLLSNYLRRTTGVARGPRPLVVALIGDYSMNMEL